MNSRASNRRLLISTLVASALLAAAPLARAVSTPAALTFSADRETVTSGQTVRLRWSATNVQQCRASGAWRGSPPVVGVQRSTPVVNTATFTLSCSGSGGMVSRSVTVRVAPGSSASSTAQSGSASASSPSQTSESSSDSLLDPALSASIKPTLNLSVDRATVAAGQQVLLRWSATQVQSCQASGGFRLRAACSRDHGAELHLALRQHQRRNRRNDLGGSRWIGIHCLAAADLQSGWNGH